MAVGKDGVWTNADSHQCWLIEWLTDIMAELATQRYNSRARWVSLPLFELFFSATTSPVVDCFSELFLIWTTFSMRYLFSVQPFLWPKPSPNYAFFAASLPFCLWPPFSGLCLFWVFTSLNLIFSKLIISFLWGVSSLNFSRPFLSATVSLGHLCSQLAASMGQVSHHIWICITQLLQCV